MDRYLQTTEVKKSENTKKELEGGSYCNLLKSLLNTTKEDQGEDKISGGI